MPRRREHRWIRPKPRLSRASYIRPANHPVRRSDLMRSRIGALVVALAIAPLAASCGSADGSKATPAASRTAGAASRTGQALPQADDPVDLASKGFTTRIDNAYWPMAPGNRWVYREGHADGTADRIEVTVTNRTREVDGVTARVIHDVATSDGALVEDTFDWYAQ